MIELERLESIINGDFCVNINKTTSIQASKENILFFLSYLGFDEEIRMEIAAAIQELMWLKYTAIRVYFEEDSIFIVTVAKQQDYLRLRPIFHELNFLTFKNENLLVIELELPKPLTKNDSSFRDIVGILESGLDYKTYLIKEAKERENKLQQQSKMASLGEMIGNIAHQWRQPLNQISSLKDMLVEDYHFNELTPERIEEFNTKIDAVLKYMSHTIDDFRNFFTPLKERTVFNINDCFTSVQNIISGSLINKNIKLSTECYSDTINVFGFPNEFSQVIINILNNAKDAILANNVSDGRVDVKVTKHLDKIVILISDNAGGIPENILPKIFEPYFSTKFASQGTGLGLYMSKNIIESSMGGQLSVSNGTEGAQFKIELGIRE